MVSLSVLLGVFSAATGTWMATAEGNTAELGAAALVLRLPSSAEAGEYVRLAQEDDQSVVRGVLIVDIRPWQVMFTG